MEIWFNPHCSKCRIAGAMLDDAGVEYTERRYLDDAPSSGEIEGVLALLGLEPWDITRMNEPIAKELRLADAPRDRDTWIAMLAAHPVLIQRPILIGSGRAVIGRSDEAIRSLLP